MGTGVIFGGGREAVKQLVVWLVTYFKARFQQSVSCNGRFNIVYHEFGHTPITSLMYGKKKREPTHWSRLGYWTTTALEKLGWCLNIEVLNITCGSAYCFWVRRFCRVSAIPPRMSSDSCIPYTCLFIIHLPFDNTINRRWSVWINELFSRNLYQTMHTTPG
jgi:hypothetical protein